MQYVRLCVYNGRMGRVNFYFSMLIVAIASAAATLLIIHISNSNNFNTTMGGSEAGYSSLQQSILNQ